MGVGASPQWSVNRWCQGQGALHLPLLAPPPPVPFPRPSSTCARPTLDRRTAAVSSKRVPEEDSDVISTGDKQTRHGPADIRARLQASRGGDARKTLSSLSAEHHIRREPGQGHCGGKGRLAWTGPGRDLRPAFLPLERRRLIALGYPRDGRGPRTMCRRDRCGRRPRRDAVLVDSRAIRDGRDTVTLDPAALFGSLSA